MPFLGRFAEFYPDILVDISLTDMIVDVAAGQADVAVRFGPLADSNLTARKLGETGYWRFAGLYGPDGYTAGAETCTAIIA